MDNVKEEQISLKVLCFFSVVGLLVATLAYHESIDTSVKAIEEELAYIVKNGCILDNWSIETISLNANDIGSNKRLVHVKDRRVSKTTSIDQSYTTLKGFGKFRYTCNSNVIYKSHIGFYEKAQ
jgi:hypothetical protein